MSSNKKPKKVQDELARLNNDETSKEVAFNPRTGELEIVDSKSDLPHNATIMTDVANDGFANLKI